VKQHCYYNSSGKAIVQQNTAYQHRNKGQNKYFGVNLCKIKSRAALKNFKVARLS